MNTYQNFESKLKNRGKSKQDLDEKFGTENLTELSFKYFRYRYTLLVVFFFNLRNLGRKITYILGFTIMCFFFLCEHLSDRTTSPNLSSTLS